MLKFAVALAKGSVEGGNFHLYTSQQFTMTKNIAAQNGAACVF